MTEQTEWESLQAGNCPYCNGRSNLKTDGERLDAAQIARIQLAGVLFHVAVAHGDEELEACVGLWYAQIQVARYATMHLRCPMPGCTFRCQVPTPRAMRVLGSHLRGAHGRTLLRAALVILTPLALMAWALLNLLLR